MARADRLMTLVAVLAAASCGDDFGGDGGGDSDVDTDADSDTDTTPAGCDEGPEANGATFLAWLASQGYQETWDHEPAFDNRRPNIRDSPHGGPIEIFVNDCVSGTWEMGAEQYPAGAIVVLDGYSDSKQPARFVEYRINDEPGEAGWWWAGWDDTDVPIGEAGQDVGCHGCHSSGDDFVRAFTLDGV